MNAQPQSIRRGDLEAKMRELQGEVTDTRESATSTLLTVGAVVVVGVVAVACTLLMALVVWRVVKRKGPGL